MFMRGNRLYILIALVAIFPLSIAAAAKPSATASYENNPHYEHVAFELLGKLKAGDYKNLDAALQSMHANKAVTVDGIDYVSTVIDIWFDDPVRLTPEIEERLLNWAKAYPKSPFPHVAHAMFLYREGWKARGKNPGRRVNAEYMKTYVHRMSVTQDEVKNAMALDDTLPLAYELAAALAVQVEGGGGIPEQDRLLAEAQAKQVHDLFGIYQQLLLARFPWLGGSEQQMLDFARLAAKDVPAGSLLPMLVTRVHEEISAYPGHGTKVAYYSQPQVWQEVEAAYKRVLADYPQAVKWMLSYARTAYNAGKMELAADYLAQALTTDPTYSEPYLLAGKIYVRDAEFDKAEKAYLDYAKLRPDDEEPYVQLAWVRIKQKRYQDAIDFVDEGIKLNAKHCELWTNRCYAQYKRGYYREALADCGKAITVDSRCQPAYDIRADTHMMLGQGMQAERDRVKSEQLK